MRHWLSPVALAFGRSPKQFGVSPMTLQNVARQTPYNKFRVFAGRAVLTLVMIKDMLWATCISISVVSAVNVLLWMWGAL